MNSASKWPWRRRDELEKLLTVWRKQYLGRSIFRAAGGPGWLSLALLGPDRRTLFCVARPGVSLLWDAEQRPPPSLLRALGQTRHAPAGNILASARLVDIRLWPTDMVVALHFTDASQRPLRLLHQLFGTRGNLVLMDGQDRLLWALHRPLHQVLLASAPENPAPMSSSTESGPDTPDTETAIQQLFHQQALLCLEQKLSTEWSAQLQGKVRRGSKTSERLVANLARDLAQADRGEELREKAETLAALLAQVPRGAANVTLTSPATGRQLSIALDPAASPAANLQHYFRLARKADRGQAVIAERLTAAEQQLARWQRLQGELAELEVNSADRLDELWRWRERNADLLGQPASTTRGPKSNQAPVGAEKALERRPFRRYRIEGSWEIWVGRNNQENDLLTHKSAAPTDYWLHAQGVAGSHVILRTGGRPEQVPRRVLQKAAAVAALHSKARNASLVPVIYTLRKYVRKPRKSLPGTAACLRQESLFAEPKLPEDVQLISRIEPT